MQARVRMPSSTGPSPPRLVTGKRLHLGRDPRCEIAFDAAAYPMVSGVHARVEPSDGEFVLVHLSRNNKTLLNDELVEGTVPLRPGDRVRMGYTGPTVEFVSIEEATASAPASAQVPDELEQSSRTIQADARHFALLRGTAGATRFEIGGGGVIGRDARRGAILSPASARLAIPRQPGRRSGKGHPGRLGQLQRHFRERPSPDAPDAPGRRRSH